MTAEELRSHLKKSSPILWKAIHSLANQWTSGIVDALERRRGKPMGFPKTFTDPVLGSIELFEWEVILLDSPLLQRLRGVRQLGMAYSVYTGATHDRLSHCLGVVEVTEQMLGALRRNANHHRRYGGDSDPDVPLPDDNDRFSLRLAALLHDVGHGPFSHATEELIEDAASRELTELREVLRHEFDGAGQIKTSEAIAAIIILSEPMQKVFEHSRFSVPFTPRDSLPLVVTARLLGSRRDLRANYLAGIVSGPVDADKLDYMARDSHFTGLPIGLDVGRLINKLEVVTITPDLVVDPELRKRVDAAPNQRIYELGISVSGLTAYEQMIIGRVLLYDRVYYHQKVRCAEAMLRRLFVTAAAERGSAFSIGDLLTNISDDGMILLLSGTAEVGELSGGGPKSQKLAQQLRNRRFYHRAFAFAERFIAGLDDLPDQDQRDTRSGLWQTVMEDFAESKKADALAAEIFELAKQLREKIPDLCDGPTDFGAEDVLIDLAEDRVIAPFSAPLLRTASGRVTRANLFFNPDKWTEAYKNQKKCGYVFAPREYLACVAIASEIVFFEKYGLVMREEARHLSKLDSIIHRANWLAWKRLAFEAKLCSPECHAAIVEAPVPLLRLRANDFRLPEEWLAVESAMKSRLEREFFAAFPGGLTASVHEAFVNGLEHMCCVLDTLEKGGEFVKDERPDEKRGLQREIMKALRARGCNAKEAAEVGGGETDILLPGDLIVENKVAGTTRDLATLKPDAPWQARRYSIAFNRRVSFVVIAYKPGDEKAVWPLPFRVSIGRLEGAPEECAFVRFLIPWGQGTPSRAKAA